MRALQLPFFLCPKTEEGKRGRKAQIERIKCVRKDTGGERAHSRFWCQKPKCQVQMGQFSDVTYREKNTEKSSSKEKGKSMGVFP